MPPNLEVLLKLGDVAASSANVAEAYKYYSQALELDPNCVQAWLGKGKSAGWSSTLADVRLVEMETCIREALKAAPVTDRSALWSDATASIGQLCVTLWGLNVQNLNQSGAMVIPEAFGLGILKKAKPVPGQAENFRASAMTILQSLQRTIDQGETFGAPSPQLYRSFLQIATHYYLTLAVVRPEADTGYREVRVEFPPEEKRYVHAMVDQYLPSAQAMDPTIPDPRGQAQARQEAANEAASPCFIATAACGSPFHPHVVLLRSFRDLMLIESPTGRVLVRWYYRWSPRAATVIATRPIARTICRALIVRPATLIAYAALRYADHTKGSLAPPA